MTEPEQVEQDEPQVTDVPEPDQEPHEPIPDEAEQDEEADVDTDDALDAEEGEPEASAPLSPFDDPARQKKVSKSFDTYAASLGRNYEEAANDLLRCPLCPDNFPGFVLLADAGRLPEENKKAVLSFVGLNVEQEYKPDPFLHVCNVCDGHGFTARPSRVAGKEKRICPACKGQGDDLIATGEAAADTNGHTDEAFTLADPANAKPDDSDNWGQPRILPDGRENPNYGRMPQYWVSVDPWGDTRNLPAQAAS